MLSQADKERYEWQLWVPGFDEASQAKLKDASVLISRCGGLGGVVALELAAAGIGKMVIAHGGNVKPSDLNRQLLMTQDWLGKPRVESIERQLLAFRPDLDLTTVNENITENNVADLVAEVDLIIDCAPLFEERYLMNRESVRQNKPMIECAMYELEAQVTTFIPGETPCLSCLYPNKPSQWKRQFPVFGAVSGTVGCMAAMDAIKLLSGLGTPLVNALMLCDLRDMTFDKVQIAPNPDCHICGATS